MLHVFKVPKANPGVATVFPMLGHGDDGDVLDSNDLYIYNNNDNNDSNNTNNDIIIMNIIIRKLLILTTNADDDDDDDNPGLEEFW